MPDDRNNQYPDDNYVDGNALAGPLAELFTVDVTTAATTCVHCGRAGALAQLRVYTSAPGLVARCDGCGGVVLRLVIAPGRAWLDMTGCVSLQLALTDPDG